MALRRSYVSPFDLPEDPIQRPGRPRDAADPEGTRPVFPEEVTTPVVDGPQPTTPDPGPPIRPRDRVRSASVPPGPVPVAEDVLQPAPPLPESTPAIEVPSLSPPPAAPLPINPSNRSFARASAQADQQFGPGVPIVAPPGQVGGMGNSGLTDEELLRAMRSGMGR